MRSEPQFYAPLSRDRKSTRLNSSHLGISYAVFCLKKLGDATMLSMAHSGAGTTLLAQINLCMFAVAGRVAAIWERCASEEPLVDLSCFFFFNDSPDTKQPPPPPPPPLPF